MRKKNTKGLFLQFKIKIIKSNLEINIAQCHECLKKGPYLIKSIPVLSIHTPYAQNIPTRFMECQNCYFLIYLLFQFYLSVFLFTIKRYIWFILLHFSCFLLLLLCLLLHILDSVAFCFILSGFAFLVVFCSSTHNIPLTQLSFTR